MRKLLISISIYASLSLAGCSAPTIDDIPELPEFPDLPLPNIVYKMDIQQGNVINQDMVNKLRPGMKKTQIRFLMGTPPIADTFHENRWDYLYTHSKAGYDDEKPRRVSLFFENDRLVRLEGTMRPMEIDENERIAQEAAIDVPAHKEDKGIILELWDKWTSEDNEEEARKRIENRK